LFVTVPVAQPTLRARFLAGHHIRGGTRVETGLNPQADSRPPDRVYRSRVAVDRWNSVAGQPTMAGRLPPRFREVLRHAVTIITLVQTLSGLGPLSTPDRVLAVVLVAALGVLWSLVVTRRCGSGLDAAYLIAVVGLGAWLHVLTGNGQVYVTGYAALFVAPVWYARRWALPPAAAGVVAIVLATMFVGKTDIAGGVGNGVGAVFFGFAAMFFGQVREGAERKAELVDELRLSRDEQQRSAVVAERARLARELHDVLAHTLSSLSLHLESTRVLAVSRGVDSDVVGRITQAVALAHDGLEEARDAVGTLRDDALPGPERLRSLVEDFAQSTGLRCGFDEVGEPVALAPDASVALFRGAQEALTNIGKHAAPDRVDVRLGWTDDQVTLRVINDGGAVGGDSSLPGGGNGLRGMRERAELAGGHLDAGPTSRGFAVELRLPTAAIRADQGVRA
jgi:signal transduction histidine kinase